MTLREFAEKHLNDNGMRLPGALAGTMALLESDECNGKDLRLDDEMEGYPNTYKAAFLLNLESVAVAWIDRNLPKAFYRSTFIHRVCQETPANAGTTP